MGCSNRKDRERELEYYRFSTIITNQGEKCKKKNQLRSAEVQLAKIGQNLLNKNLQNVCVLLNLLAVKSQQGEIMRILDSKNIRYELIDISVGGDVRDEMRSKSGNPTAVPPQLFNEDEYCGDYQMFSEAVEMETVEKFLKLA